MADDVIGKALDELERNSPSARKTVDSKVSALPGFDGKQPPNLTFTKVVSASFNGTAIRPANWNRLLDAALAHASKNMGNFAKLQRLAAVNVIQGKKLDEGYHYLPGVDFSVQGQDANAAWRSVMFIAQNLKCPVEVSFIWRNKQGAEHPGKAGSMSFSP